jgi:predicted DsbA family dithiol-disulfide isomerase
MQPVTVNITSDFICPWCWIGHHHLRSAIEQAGLDESSLNISYAPFELNPTMPKDGLDRKTYRSKKFGSWSRSLAMDAQVTEAGRHSGVDFRYENVLITPNTRLAHRVMSFAQRIDGSQAKTETLFESLFAAYFSKGHDIGKQDVLLRLAEQAGLDKEALAAYLDAGSGTADVEAAEIQAQLHGIFSVPDIQINGGRISGAQPAKYIAELLKAAAAGTTAVAQA